MIIPDYLIIDEIKRREEKKWQPETQQIPLYIPELPEDNGSDVPKPKEEDERYKRENGAIIISLFG